MDLSWQLSWFLQPSTLPSPPSTSMTMSRVRIDSAARFVLQRHLHLMRTPMCDDVARKQRAVISDHNRRLIAVLDMYRNAIEGLGDMPERGFCDDCTDAEVRAAVNYMLRQLP